MLDIRHTNVGNYSVIDVGQAGQISVECRLLRRTHENWVMMDRPWANGIHGGALIPEEAVFEDNIRFPHLARRPKARRVGRDG
jgi:hypothetical protein